MPVAEPIRIPISFTLDDLLQVLRQGAPQQDLSAYHTVEEWCDHFRIGSIKMRKLLHRAHKLGLLRLAYRPAVSLTGYSYGSPVYAFALNEPDV